MVRAKRAELALGQRQRRLARCRKGAPTLLVVGGGAAGHTAIETLRYIETANIMQFAHVPLLEKF